MRFKQFEIRKPTLLREPLTEDYYKYNFDIVKWAEDNTHCWSIGFLRWNAREPCFEFESVGLRYFKHREDGLEDFILRWCELQSFIIRSSEEGE